MDSADGGTSVHTLMHFREEMPLELSGPVGHLMMTLLGCKAVRWTVNQHNSTSPYRPAASV